MSGILRIANLCKTYSITNTERQEVLKGINIELESGELVALLGESGCGKSTLLHILGGMDTDYTGSVVVKGKFIRDFSEQEMDEYRKKGIGMIFQNYNLISHMTLKENVEIALELSNTSKEEKEKRALDLLNIVGLKDHKDKFPNQLSGGQKQRVAIARCLANNPSIILADEPTGALDKDATKDIIKLLKRISSMGKLVVVVTHSQLVANECTRVLEMDNGIIIKDTIKEKPAKSKYEKYKEIEPKNISIKAILRLAFKNVINTLKRSLLVSLGISIGITALILILCLSDGITNYVKDYYASDELSTIVMTSNNSKTISSSSIQEIENTYGVSKVYKSFTTSLATYTIDDTSNSLGDLYCYHDNVIFPEIIYGKTKLSSDEIVINLKLAQELSEDSVIGAIGKTIDVSYSNSTQSFTVVGIFDNSSEEKTSYISLSDMNDFKSVSYNLLYVKAKDITYLDSVCDYLKDEGYTITTFDDSSSTILDYIDLGTSVLVAISLISTIVSLIMIIIVEHISVMERTQEIGILRSIGSRKKDISRIFMIESSYLGLIGGVIAIIMSLSLSLVIGIITKITMNYYFISFNILYYLLGLFVSILISVIAGIAPARKAAGLDPVEALRFE